MTDITRILKEIGFNDNEVKLYLALIRFGQKPISFLAKKTNLNRGLAYTILHDLVEKGLATKQSKGRVQYFSAMEPEQLLAHLESKKKLISTQQERVKEILSQLNTLSNPFSSKPKVRTFDGIEGVRSLLSQIRVAKDNKLLAYISFAETVAFIGDEDLSQFIEQLCSYNYNLDIIRTREKARERLSEEPEEKIEYPKCLNVFSKRSSQLNLRYAPRDLPFPMSMFIFDDKIALLSSESESFGVLIESKEFSGMQRNIFELIWASLSQTTVRIGIAHSLSGTMAISERPLVDALLMAIEEINQKGGILGKRVDPIVIDCESNPKTFAKKTESIIIKQDVNTIFGGWTSASRKRMLPLIEKYDSLLWYSIQYEGLEDSENTIYTGASPNQQILPAIDWAINNLGKKCFLVGSDYVYPVSANEIAKSRINELGAKVVGEDYIPLGSSSVSKIVKKIIKNKPDFILNTINGDTNIAFFKELRKQGITSKKIPTISFSIGEEEVSRMDTKLVTGDYAAWCYFQSFESKENKKFIENFKNKYGSYRVTGDPIQTSYLSMLLYAAAVESAGSFETNAVKEAARGLTIRAPEGTVRIDPDNFHLHRKARIGRFDLEGQIEAIWSSKTAIKPDPFPGYKSKQEWKDFIKSLYKKWENNWQK